MTARGNFQRLDVVAVREFFVVHAHLLDPHRRRQRIQFDARWISGHQSFRRRKPQPPVRRFAARRLQTFGTFERRQPVVNAVIQKNQFGQFAVRAAVQILFARTQDAAVGTHPEKSAPVRFDVSNDAVGQTLFAIDDGKFSALEPIQTAAKCADPQRAIVGKMQALDEVGRKPVGFFEPAKISVLQTNEAAARRAEPQRARFVLRNGTHVAERLAVYFAEPLQFSVVVTQQASRGADPKFIAQKQKRRNRRAKIFKARRKIKRVVLLREQSSSRYSRRKK